MSTNTKVLLVISILLTVSSAARAQRIVFTTMASNVFAQEEGLSRAEKLRMIDREIELAQQEKKSGIIKVVAGVGCYVLGYAFIPWTEYEYDWESGSSTVEHGSAGLFLAGIVGGVVLEVWGGWQWWSAAQQVNLLKAKRYDIVLRPTLIPSPDGSIVLGYKISMSF